MIFGHNATYPSKNGDFKVIISGVMTKNRFCKNSLFHQNLTRYRFKAIWFCGLFIIWRNLSNQKIISWINLVLAEILTSRGHLEIYLFAMEKNLKKHHHECLLSEYRFLKANRNLSSSALQKLCISLLVFLFFCFTKKTWTSSLVSHQQMDKGKPKINAGDIAYVHASEAMGKFKLLRGCEQGWQANVALKWVIIGPTAKGNEYGMKWTVCSLDLLKWTIFSIRWKMSFSLL